MKSMTNYEWNEQFYKELIIDYNYRFPKFMEISYPNHQVRKVLMSNSNCLPNREANAADFNNKTIKNSYLRH